MKLTRVALGLHWVPLLSGCMMGMATGGMGTAAHSGSAPTSGSLQHAEASSGDLTIMLSFPTPTTASAVPMEARLAHARSPDQRIDGEIWLRIRAPGGSIDELRMQRLDSSAGRIYQAMYSFRDPGPYVVTADGREETDAVVRTVSVTTTAVAESQGMSYGGGNEWLMPVAILGGLGMVVMMALMIVG